jgi:hypothetical protein
MISNEAYLQLVQGELAKRRDSLAALEAARAKLPPTVSGRVGLPRVATIRQEIRELEMEVHEYEAAKGCAGVYVPASDRTLSSPGDETRFYPNAYCSPSSPPDIQQR